MRLLLAWFALACGAPLFTVDEPIEGAYIVVFNKGLSKSSIAQHKELAALKGVQIDRHYAIGDQFNGYAARINQHTLNFVLNLEEVKYVSQDGIARIDESWKAPKSCETQTGTTWGLARTTTIFPDITGNYYYNQEGRGVFAYIVDTGIYVEHDEFNAGGVSRAFLGANFVDTVDTDQNGHGTHVAGTVGGEKYGMAKKVQVIAVKVLGANGSGSWSAVIEGISWAANDIRRPATVNLSLGGGTNQAVNDALDAAVEKGGLTYVCAAGNNGGDACHFSPAGASKCITIGSIDNTDTRPASSNHGSCVSLFAPGVGITSAWIGSPSADATISGTSMAAPHVVGMIAKLLSMNPSALPAEVKAWIVDRSTGGLLKNIPANTPNQLLYGNCSTFNSPVVRLTKRYS